MAKICFYFTPLSVQGYIRQIHIVYTGISKVATGSECESFSIPLNIFPSLIYDITVYFKRKGKNCPTGTYIIFTNVSQHEKTLLLLGDGERCSYKTEQKSS